ncbi:hypothetical protein BASA81_003217 [Batrachochytrium salamandrivorans]|nr:hypothetical protein BASA81_003217 [Batrachochytrium salamandrivorans]
MGFCEEEDTNSTSHYPDQDLDSFMVLLAFIAAAFATSIAMLNITKHLLNYTRPEFQKSLIRIIFIVPVYSASCLMLAFPDYAIVVESIRDCWEAVVIYEFLRLILAYCGGESACLTVIMKNPGSITHMFPFNFCLRPIRLDSRFMRLCKQLTLQFVFIKPLMAIVNIVMFSESSRRPLTKFVGVKLIIFATYYQGLLVKLMPGFSTHYLEALNSFIFCFEMIFFSLFYLWAFGWYEFVDGGQGVGIGDDSDFSAAMEGDYEIGGMMPPPPPTFTSTSTVGNKTKVLEKNVKDAFNMGDVVGDAAENFNTKYQNHVRLDTTSKNEALDEHLMMDDEDEVGQNPFLVITEQGKQQPIHFHSDPNPPAPSSTDKSHNPFDQH